MWYLNVSYILALCGLVLVLLALMRVTSGSVNAWVRKLLLLVFGVGFLYAYDPALLGFYLGYIAVNYLFTLAILSVPRGKKTTFIASIVFNVGVLTTFRLAHELNLLLTVGLIYNLLKAIDAQYYAYYVERRVAVLHFLLYMLFIPTFTSGPILKLKDFDDDLGKAYKPDAARVEVSTKRIIEGLFKKIVLVALLWPLYNFLLAKDLNIGWSTLVLLTYYILLYFDFSGYSDIAIGFGTLLGFRIPENFKKPFSSPTFTVFWRNWHASLGDWFRDHVFLVLSRRNMSRMVAGGVSLLIMIGVGLWHGFDWLFLGWGLYHGVLLLLENLLNLTTVNKRKAHPAYYWSRALVTNAGVAFGTIYFSKDLATAGRILHGFTHW
ncbi:MBOAT family O-acyltransferase [Tumebacillus permanentifrigoris]|uniref:Alginate O-acetyltransferase complex protein AlgI n=1 Tax=Tumebacillus permanentifrigoris TaxID=378543 RepID=A0A316D5X5_9BACL|nr:MBOAT family O-acyltransferase [Tumebacillus permanentifrigoris]PWK09646.1 alginate O-acetyltransferase complex protein AlgI [Tumebacillus permanentifrigoris]